MMGYRHGSPALFHILAEHPIGAFGTQPVPAEPVSRHPAGGRGHRRAPLSTIPADQLSPGATGGSDQRAEGVATGYRAADLQLLPSTRQGRLGPAGQLQGIYQNTHHDTFMKNI